MSLKTRSQDIFATPWAVIFILIGTYRAILEKRSTITNIPSYPADSGSSLIKLILTISQGFCGTLLG